MIRQLSCIKLFSRDDNYRVSAFLPLDWNYLLIIFSVLHLDVEDSSEELLRQQSYAIKNQFVASKDPY